MGVERGVFRSFKEFLQIEKLALFQRGGRRSDAGRRHRHLKGGGGREHEAEADLRVALRGIIVCEARGQTVQIIIQHIAAHDGGRPARRQRAPLPHTCETTARPVAADASTRSYAPPGTHTIRSPCPFSNDWPSRISRGKSASGVITAFDPGVIPPCAENEPPGFGTEFGGRRVSKKISPRSHAGSRSFPW
jgi:hypothetical protein